MSANIWFCHEEAALKEVLGRHPELDLWGFVRPGKWADHSKMMGDAACEQFRAAVKWLAAQRRFYRHKPAEGTSYSLASAIGCSHGVFIAAAFFLDIKVWRCASESKEAWLGIASDGGLWAPASRLPFLELCDALRAKGRIK